jgi:hypothetical protein
VPPAQWDKVIGPAIHPTRIAIVAAMEWLDHPVSPALLRLVLGGQMTVGHVGYHVRKLAEGGVINQVFERPVRGTWEHFYLLVPAETSEQGLSLKQGQITALRELLRGIKDDAFAEVAEADGLAELREALQV